MRRTATLLALALVGCGGGGTPEAAPTTGAATTSPPPSAGPVSFTYGRPFYTDAFRDRTKGWPEKDGATAAYRVHPEYATPLYTMTAKKAGYELFPHPEFRGVQPARLADYQVTATLQTTLAIGHDDLFGLTCRDLDGQRYVFRVGYDIDGHDTMPWTIAKQDGDRTHVLASGAETVGGSAFEVGATCAGDGPAHLALTVNGRELGRVDDADAPLTEGYAGTYLYTKNGRSTLNVLDFAVRPATAAYS